MASAWGQMEKQEGQGLHLEEGWGGASVSPSTSPFSSLQPLLFLPSASLCLPIPGTLSSGLGSAAANVPGLSLERQGGLGGLGKKRPQWV